MNRWLNRWVNRPEVEQLRRMADRPLVVVCGPSGSGKSRLIHEAFRDAEVVELRGVEGAAETRDAIADKLGCDAAHLARSVKLVADATGRERLVLDGLAPDAFEVAAELAGVVPIVVASRVPAPDHVPCLHLGPLDGPAARELWNARLEEQGVHTLAEDSTAEFEQCARWPAAVEAGVREYVSPLAWDHGGSPAGDPALARLALLCDPFDLDEAMAVLGAERAETVAVLEEATRSGRLYEVRGTFVFDQCDEWEPPDAAVMDWYNARAAQAPGTWVRGRARMLWRLVGQFGAAASEPVLVALARDYFDRGAHAVLHERLASLEAELATPAVRAILAQTEAWRGLPDWETRAWNAARDPATASNLRARCMSRLMQREFVDGTLDSLSALYDSLAEHVASLESADRAAVELRYQYGRFLLGAEPSECAERFPDPTGLEGVLVPTRHYYLAIVKRRLGEYDAVLRLCERAIAAAEQGGFLLAEAYARVQRREIAVRLAAPGTWERPLEQDLEWARRHGVAQACAWFELSRAEALLTEGEFEGARAAADRSASYALPTFERDLNAWLRIHRARAALIEGAVEDCRAQVAALDVWSAELQTWQRLLQVILRVRAGQPASAMLRELADMLESFPIKRPAVRLFAAVVDPTSSAAQRAEWAARLAAVDSRASLFNIVIMDELRRLAPATLGLVELFAAGHNAVCAADGAWMWVSGTLTDLDGKPVTQRLIAALLAANAPVGVDELGEQLWPGEYMTDDSLRTRVRTHVHRLRKSGLDVHFADDGYELRGAVGSG